MPNLTAGGTIVKVLAAFPGSYAAGNGGVKTESLLSLMTRPELAVLAG